MGCIEITRYDTSIRKRIWINSNMGCIEMGLDSISDVEPVWINSNMGCIEMIQYLFQCLSP